MFLLKLIVNVGFRVSYIFTFHNVSIKTYPISRSTSTMVSFTFHNVSIKTFMTFVPYLLSSYLHSTMFLLKRYSPCNIFSAFSHLHSTMFLLKLFSHFFHHLFFLHLHSTMFLLKQCPDSHNIPQTLLFTFHNVSIKTEPVTLKLDGFSHIYIPQCFY